MNIFFRVDRLRPDQRQYRQTEIELIPDAPLSVAIEVPDNFVMAMSGGLEDAFSVITLEGLKAIVQQCDLVFMGTKIPNKQSNDDEPNDEEFSE